MNRYEPVSSSMKLNWNDWREVKPKDEPGHYLVWSHKQGLRLISDHPSWWNQPRRVAGMHPGPRVRFWIKVAEHGVGLKLRERALRR
jgi:hypothetical protein